MTYNINLILYLALHFKLLDQKELMQKCFKLEDAFLRSKKESKKTNSKKKVRTKRIKVKKSKATASIAKTQRNIAKEIKSFALAAGIKKTKKKKRRSDKEN